MHYHLIIWNYVSVGNSVQMGECENWNNICNVVILLSYVIIDIRWWKRNKISHICQCKVWQWWKIICSIYWDNIIEWLLFAGHGVIEWNVYWGCCCLDDILRELWRRPGERNMRVELILMHHTHVRYSWIENRYQFI